MSGSPRQSQTQGGFTLIELLVVILIIAILAAIAIPVFYRQREKGWESQIQSSLKDAATALETYATGHNGSYDDPSEPIDEQDGTVLDPYGFQMPAWALSSPGYLRIEANGQVFCIEARHNLLTSGSAWRRSTYQSGDGRPAPTPDNCPEIN